MSHPVLPAVACCCAGGGGGMSDCYCGSLCMGCQDVSDACNPDPVPTVCIAATEWGDNFGDLSGTGDGALIAIDGVWYYFDGTTTPCEDPVDPALIDWANGVRIDECPEACPHTQVRITWSGSVTYVGLCCEYDDGINPPGCAWTNAWSSTQSAKVSPDLTINSSGACTDDQGTTSLEYVTVGTECSPTNGFEADAASINHRLLFRILRDYGDCVWVIWVQCSASLAGSAETFFALRFTAPLSVCPPTTGWTLDVAGSTYPTTDGISPDCSDPAWANSLGVSAFSAGSVSLEFV